MVTWTHGHDRHQAGVEDDIHTGVADLQHAALALCVNRAELLRVTECIRIRLEWNECSPASLRHETGDLRLDK